MHCHEAKRRLTEVGSTAKAHRDDAALQAHLAKCDACARAAEATHALRQAFDTINQAGSGDMPSFDQVKRQIEDRVLPARTAVRGKRSIMAKIWNPLSGRTRWSIGLVTATAVLAFLTLMPFSYQRTVGYSVALAGVDKDLAMDEGRILVLLNRLGVNGASIELGECETTCELTIADVDSRDHCRIIIAAMKQMGEIRVIHEGKAQFELANGALIEVAANNLHFGKHESMPDHEVREVVLELLGDDISGRMSIFVTKVDAAHFDGAQISMDGGNISFGVGTIKGSLPDGSNFAFMCCDADDAGCDVVLDKMNLVKGFDGSSSSCIFISKGEGSPMGHLSELLAEAGINLASISDGLDDATMARLEALGIKIQTIDGDHNFMRMEYKSPGQRSILKWVGKGELHEVPESEVDKSAKAAVVPEGYALNQNYPNPFNPQTTISFTLAQSEAVRIDIINVLGRIVRTLKNETMSAGTHEVLWNARSDAGVRVPSGMYLYRIEAGSFVDTRTMTLLK